jgi:serine/threonine protein kinase
MNEPVSSSLLSAESDKCRFEIQDLLGRGGMGDVFKAWDAELEQDVALKSLRGSASADPFTLERFKLELKLARRIKHVNVAQVHDLVTQDGVRYLSMEYVDGKPLSDILAAKGRLSVRVALAILRQVCSGVQAAHEVGVIHRDLKPHNVMISRRSGRAIVLDFGIARETGGGELTEAGVILGSPQYMSYEQLAGLPVTPRSDVYSLGILLFELVTGVSPFRVPGAAASTLRALREVAPDPRTHDAGLPDYVSEATARCLDPDPGARFATPMALLRFLDEARRQPDVETEPEVSTTVQIDSGVIPIAAAPAALVALPDGPERREILSRLERIGLRVELVDDGMQAVEACFAASYPIILLGGVLDRMDGFTACQLMRRNPKAEDARIMLLLAGDATGREAFAREVGATDVLRRPLNVHALTRKVRTMLSEMA